MEQRRQPPHPANGEQKMCDKPGCRIATDADEPFCRNHVGYFEHEIEKRTAARTRQKDLIAAKEKEVKRKHDEIMGLLAKKEKEIAVKRANINSSKFVAYLHDDTYLKDNKIKDPILEQLIKDMKEKDKHLEKVSEAESKRFDEYIKKIDGFAKDDSLNKDDGIKDGKKEVVDKDRSKPHKKSTPAEKFVTHADMTRMLNEQFNKIVQLVTKMAPPPPPTQQAPPPPTQQDLERQAVNEFLAPILSNSPPTSPKKVTKKTDGLTDVDTDEEKLISDVDKINLDKTSPERRRLRQHKE